MVKILTYMDVTREPAFVDSTLTFGGLLLDEYGTPLEGKEVWLIINGMDVSSVITSYEGEWSFEYQLGPGVYSVQAVFFGDETYEWCETPIYEVSPPVTYTLNITSSAGGTTDPAPGLYDYPGGTTARVTAYPDLGYLFYHWELDGIPRTENPIDVLMDADHTLHAVFVTAPPPEYTLTISATAGGTTDPAPGPYAYLEGTVARVTAIPGEGYRLDRWELDGIPRTENPIDVLMDADHALLAVFTGKTPTYMDVTQEPVEVSPGVHRFAGYLRSELGYGIGGREVKLLVDGSWGGLATITEPDGYWIFEGALMDYGPHVIVASFEGDADYEACSTGEYGVTRDWDYYPYLRSPVFPAKVASDEPCWVDVSICVPAHGEETGGYRIMWTADTSVGMDPPSGAGSPTIRRGECYGGYSAFSMGPASFKLWILKDR